MCSTSPPHWHKIKWSSTWPDASARQPANGGPYGLGTTPRMPLTSSMTPRTVSSWLCSMKLRAPWLMGCILPQARALDHRPGRGRPMARVQQQARGQEGSMAPRHRREPPPSAHYAVCAALCFGRTRQHWSSGWRERDDSVFAAPTGRKIHRPCAGTMGSPGDFRWTSALNWEASVGLGGDRSAAVNTVWTFPSHWFSCPAC